jgi:hypothetical protein
MADDFTDLFDRIDNPPKSWTPNGIPDNLDPENCVSSVEIAGTVEGVETRESEFGDFPMVILNTGEGRVQVAAMHETLKRRLEHVQVGQRVAIRYNGRTPSKTSGHADYYDYSVAVG